ncbi:MAG: Rieske 2Fe-2S domain-containing protein [Acidimicrobiales bacterium]
MNDAIDHGSPVKPPEYRQVVTPSDPLGIYDLGSKAEFWRLFWHPVCTLHELRAHCSGGRGPLQTTLLGERILVADMGGAVRAFSDRCPHRGSSLSLGWLEKDTIRCRYHGWCFDSTGACTEVPSLAAGEAIPARARLSTYDCQVAYDLVWVRMDGSANTEIPRFPAWEDESQVCIMGQPYLWPASAGRRVENFIDVSHFPYAHQGTLGAPPLTQFPTFAVDQIAGELRWKTETFLAFNPGDATYGPPVGPDSLMLPPATYVIGMPLTVVLIFNWSEDRATQIFMHPTPIDSENCRSYWFTCHTVDGSTDEEHLALQSIVLTEDLPVVASHIPRAIGQLRDEVSVPADKPVVFWRRWLWELIRASQDGGSAVHGALSVERIESESEVGV